MKVCLLSILTGIVYNQYIHLLCFHLLIGNVNEHGFSATGIKAPDAMYYPHSFILKKKSFIIQTLYIVTLSFLTSAGFPAITEFSDENAFEHKELAPTMQPSGITQPLRITLRVHSHTLLPMIISFDTE